MRPHSDDPSGVRVRWGLRDYKNYLLSVLLAILVFNRVDQVAFGLALQNIKFDLELSDTQLGFVTGIAFALFYSVMGIPIARWADRGNRVTIISIMTTLQCGAVVLCGLAGNYLQLLLIRVGVAVGEAGCTPPAHSLIADYFTRAERPRAVARYMLGAPVASVIGYFFGGWLNQLYGWRVTFMLMGVPGLCLAAVAWFTLREPRSANGVQRPRAETSDTLSASDADSASALLAAPSLKEVCVALWKNVTFRRLLFAYSVMSFFGAGITQWKPAFYVRSFGLETGELGTWFAAIYGVCGLFGVYWGGELASRYAAHNERLQLRAIAIAYCGFGVLSACIYLSRSPYVAFGLMAVATLGLYMVTGPFFATIQTVVPARMRAISIALIYLFANLIGMGLGPFLVGVLSDALRPQLGDESLRYALLCLCVGYVWCGWHLWLGSRSVGRDVEALRVEWEAVEAQESRASRGAGLHGRGGRALPIAKPSR